MCDLSHSHNQDALDLSRCRNHQEILFPAASSWIFRCSRSCSFEAPARGKARGSRAEKGVTQPAGRGSHWDDKSKKGEKGGFNMIYPLVMTNIAMV